MTSQVQAPNDLSFHEVKVGGHDVTSFVLLTDIFQDIFTPFWTAQIIFADGQNLPMTLPLAVGTEISITIETNAPVPCSGKKNFKFYVYKISQRKLEKQETQTYIAHCITSEFFQNQKARVQKAFRRTPPVDIVAEIISNMGGGLENSDDDPTKYDLIIPNWAPVPAVEWVCRFAKTPGGGADFVLFQADDGKFNFRSVEKMFKEKSGLVLKQMQPNIRTDDHNEDDEVFVNMETYEFRESHDAGPRMQAGFYANTILTHDIINKTITPTEFKMGDDISQDRQMKNYTGGVLDGMEKSHISYTPDHPGMNNGLNPENTHVEWTGSRKTNILKLEENRLIVTIPGAACLWKALGKGCEVELPSHQDIEEGELYDKYMRGDYLIMAIKHTITFGQYTLTLELGKKRLDKPLP